MSWATTFNFGRNFTANANEPAFTSANTVRMTMMSPPFKWRWNRNTIGWYTVAGVQDYTLINWSASYQILPSNGSPTSVYLIDSNGYSQQGSAGTTGLTIPSFNSTVGGTTVDGTVTWTNVGALYTTLGINSIWSLNWIETTSVLDPVANKWYEAQSKLCLGLDSPTSRPKFIAAQSLDNLGNVGFRLLPSPDNAYQILMNTQAVPTLFTSTSQTWSPIPDAYSHIYNWGFLALMFLYSDDYRFGYANQKFVTSLLAANEGLTETEINIFLNNWQNITGQPLEKINRLQQGTQARGS